MNVVSKLVVSSAVELRDVKFVAKLLDIDVAAVTRAKCGKVDFSKAQLERIAASLNSTIGQLAIRKLDGPMAEQLKPVIAALDEVKVPADQPARMQKPATRRTLAQTSRSPATARSRTARKPNAFGTKQNAV